MWFCGWHAELTTKTSLVYLDNAVLCLPCPLRLSEIGKPAVKKFKITLVWAHNDSIGCYHESPIQKLSCHQRVCVEVKQWRRLVVCSYLRKLKKYFQEVTINNRRCKVALSLYVTGTILYSFCREQWMNWRNESLQWMFTTRKSAGTWTFQFIWRRLSPTLYED